MRYTDGTRRPPAGRVLFGAALVLAALWSGPARGYKFSARWGAPEWPLGEDAVHHAGGFGVVAVRR